MEVNNNIVESSSYSSSSSSSRRRRSSKRHNKQEVASFSNLPDPIIIDILSRLPTRDAVKTLIFSAFGPLWTSIHNLDFDSCSYHDCSCDDYSDGNYNEQLVNLVRNVLSLHQCSKIERFRLRFEFALDHQYQSVPDDIQAKSIMMKERKLALEINSWIRFSVGKKVKILELDFMACGLPVPEYYYQLPSSVLSSDSIMDLKLVSCGLKPWARINMCSLKTLFLEEIVLTDDMMENVLSGCPLLESLSIVECYGLNKLICSSQNLKYMMLDLGIVEESQVELHCPYVMSLNISGWIVRADPKNLLSVVDASLNFTRNFECAPGEHREIRMILEKLRHAKALTICSRCILVLTVWELMNQLCPSLNVRCLVLKTMPTKWHLPGIIRLLRNSPTLEMLEIYISPGKLPISTDEYAWLQSHEFRGDHYWNSEQQSFKCLSNHLKTVTIHGYESGHAQLVKFLLKNAAVLEKMVINTNRDKHPDDQNLFASEKSHKSFQKLLNAPRASSHAIILFS